MGAWLSGPIVDGVERSAGVVRQVGLMGPIDVNDAAAGTDRDGNEADATELFRDLSPELLRLASAVTFDASMAEEVVQDAFVGLLQRDGNVDNETAYLRRSVVNRAIDRVRRRERFRLLPERRAPGTRDVDVDELWPLIAQLPAQQRALVALRFYEDLTYEQIAHTLDMPAGSVKSGLHRALKKLKEQM